MSLKNILKTYSNLCHLRVRNEQMQEIRHPCCSIPIINTLSLRCLCRHCIAQACTGLFTSRHQNKRHSLTHSKWSYQNRTATQYQPKQFPKCLTILSVQHIKNSKRCCCIIKVTTIGETMGVG